MHGENGKYKSVLVTSVESTTTIVQFCRMQNKNVPLVSHTVKSEDMMITRENNKSVWTPKRAILNSLCHLKPKYRDV